MLVPRIELHGRIFFRHLRCPQKRADAIAEMLALAWKWFVQLAKRGKDSAKFVTTFAGLAARAVWNGRRVCGQETAKDVFSVQAQIRHGFKVESLPERSTMVGRIVDEAMCDNRVSPVPDQVAFRVDFPAWADRYSERDRRLIEDMMLGERTFDLSAKYGLSPARISQKRGEFEADWQRFCGEPAFAA